MDGHILQSKEWAEFRLKTPSVKRVLKVGCCQIYVHQIPHLPWTVAYLPRPIKIESLGEVISACKREKAIFLKVEPATDCRLPTAGYRISQPILPRHTIYIDLGQSEEELQAGMHEKTRYNIRLAQKKAIRVTEGEDLEGFTRLLENTEQRQGFYSHPSSYYRTLWETLRPHKMVYLLSAFEGEDLVASIMLLRHERTLYYAYGGSDPKYRELMAPHLLHWEAMKLGKGLNCRIYDLWGSYRERPEESDPWWGIYRFKKGFGGREITFPETFDIPLSPLYFLYPLAEKLRGLTRE